MSRRVISQEAFDEIVHENINDFEMGVDEAIDDAVQQLEAQNVDFSNIVKDMVKMKMSNASGNNGDHPAIAAVEQLKTASSGDSPDVETLSAALGVIREQCAIDLAHRCLVGQHHAMEAIFRVFEVALNRRLSPLLDLTLSALAALLDGQPDIISAEQLAVFARIVGGMEMVEASSWLSEEQLAGVIRILRLVCIMHEANRQKLVGLDIVHSAVRRIGWDDPEEVKISGRVMVIEVCQLLHALTLDDDIRVPFGKSHEVAKTIVTETPSLEVLLRVCRAYKAEEDHEVVSAAFTTLSKLSVRNEFCQTLLDCGGVGLILESLSNHVSNQTVVRTSFMLLKSLAGNDNVKTEVGRCNGIPIVVEALQRFVANPPIAHNGCAALAMVCLRQPANGKLAVEAGAPALLEQILKVNLQNANVFRQVCHVVRNIASRCPDLRTAFLTDFAFEQLLNETGLSLCPDEAKAALRDLGCKVAFNEPWTGEKGQLVNQN